METFGFEGYLGNDCWALSVGLLGPSFSKQGPALQPMLLTHTGQ